MKKFKLLACLLLVMVVFAACSNDKKTEDNPAGEDTNKQTEEGLNYTKVIVGVDDTFAPMGFRDVKSELVGFDIELAKAVFEQLGITVEFQVIDWSTKETELNNKNIDLIWNGYTINDERKEKVNFSNAYLENKQVIVTMAKSNIKTIADLKGKVVATQTSSSAEEVVNADKEVKDTFKKFITLSTYDDCLRDLASGRTDAVVGDEVFIKYYISQVDASKYYILEENFGNEEYGVGVRKEDTALLKAINDTIEKLKTDGTAKAISEKWFGQDIVK